MRKTAFALLFQFLSASMLSAHDLMPVPMSAAFRAGTLAAAPVATYFVNLSAPRIDGAVERAGETLGLSFERGAEENSFLKIYIQEKGSFYPQIGDDESYRLTVGEQEIVLASSTALGALRGLQTLRQLAIQKGGKISFAMSSIEDRPRFKWRGLLLDTARHFFSVEAVKRQIVAMAMVKMNVLHLHLSDDQGFRVESKRFPLLQLAGSNGLYYTQEQIKEIIDFAAERGVRVVPEFDVPGHTTSWLAAYPNLGSSTINYVVSKRFGVHDAAMNPASEETYLFLEELFEEMAGLFPDRYFHMGGDEVTGKTWERNPEIKAFMRQNGMAGKKDLQAFFTARVAEILEKLGKKPAGWDEVLHENNQANMQELAQGPIAIWLEQTSTCLRAL